MKKIIVSILVLAAIIASVPANALGDREKNVLLALTSGALLYNVTKNREHDRGHSRHPYVTATQRYENSHQYYHGPRTYRRQRCHFRTIETEYYDHWGRLVEVRTTNVCR